MTDRLRCDILDTRSGSWTRLGLPTVGQTDPVRHVDCERTTLPHCYLLTDHHLLLSDLRMPRAPVLSQLTGLGRHTGSPSWLWGRTRLDSQDWVVTGDTWADLRLTVLDWSHSHCHTARQAEDLWIHCQAGEGSEGPPRVLGGVESLGTWRDSVVTARALGGQWLHPALEQRAALPFTGLALSAEPGSRNNINIIAVNAIGDLFGKVLHLEEEEEIVGHDDVESEEDNSHQVERWLTDWAEAVVSKSFLPQVTLSNRFPSGQNERQTLRLNRGYKFRLPVFVQSKRWKKRFRGSKQAKRASKVKTKARAMDKPVFLPCITDAEWPENLTEVHNSGQKMLNIKAVKEEMIREGINNSFGSNGFQISEPKNVNPRKSESKKGISPLSLVIDAKLEKEEKLKDEIHLHHIQQFKQLNLEDFYNSSSREDNSSRILKIMLGEKEDTTASRRMSTVSTSSGVPSPAPPTEEDTSFPLASFWEDLGVDMPSVRQSQSQEVDQAQFDEEEYEL